MLGYDDGLWQETRPCELCGEHAATRAAGDYLICKYCYEDMRDTLFDYVGDALLDVAAEFDISPEDVWDVFEIELDCYECLKIGEKMETQRKQIKEHLQKYGTITPLEALQLYGSMRLAARIAELRKEGMKIETNYGYSRTGARFAAYTLVEDK